MKYTAEITNKDIIDGELVIQIRYTGDDGTILQDSARTRDIQDEDWAKSLIVQKIKSLEELPNFVDTIFLGAVDLTNKEPVLKTKTLKEKWLEEYRYYSKMFDLYRKGIIKKDNEKLVDLCQTLIDTFDINYID